MNPPPPLNVACASAGGSELSTCQWCLQVFTTSVQNGRDPEFSESDKMVFHNVDPTLNLSITVDDTYRSIKDKVTMRSQNLGVLNVPISRFSKAGKLTETFQVSARWHALMSSVTGECWRRGEGKADR